MNVFCRTMRLRFCVLVNLDRRPGLIRRMAERFKPALGALRFARNADRAPMPDYAMREVDPLVAGDHVHQVLLNLNGFVIAGKFKATCNAVHMRIHHDALRFPKPGTENYVGRLASSSGYGQKLMHFFRNLAAEIMHDLLRSTDD